MELSDLSKEQWIRLEVNQLCEFLRAQVELALAMGTNRKRVVTFLRAVRIAMRAAGGKGVRS